jgi:4-hydroxy-tetrahydrodipicolinate synthase
MRPAVCFGSTGDMSDAREPNQQPRRRLDGGARESMGQHLLSERASGVFVIGVTPFIPGGAIDYTSVDRLLDFYLECGVHGLTILGMMGEAHKLTAEESLALTRHVLKRTADALPVVVGASGTSFETMGGLARCAMDLGAAGVMIAPAAGLKTDDQIYRYYEGVFAAIGEDVPVVYQDYPQSTGVYLATGVFLRLVAAYPQLLMLKHEDCPGLGKITAIRRESEQRGVRRVSILVGNGGLYFPLELSRGADGAMTGFAYPEMLVAVYDRFAAGDVAGAEDLFDSYLPLVRYEQQPNMGLAIRKEILCRRGAIASSTLRAPGYPWSAADAAELDHLIERLNRQLAVGTL